jgi:replicative DNA helicase
MISGPANIEAEQAVLGACLLSREALAVAGFLDPAHFAEELHRRIFAAMRERLAEGALATLVTLGPLLGDLDLPEGAAAPAYLARLAASAPSIVNAPDYARQIVDHARRAGRAGRRGVAGHRRPDRGYRRRRHRRF